MSTTITVDFSNQLSAIDLELNSSDYNPGSFKLLTKVKEIIQSAPNTFDKELFNRILSQLNTTMAHLSSTGYTGSTVPNIINHIQGYLSQLPEVEAANQINKSSTTAEIENNDKHNSQPTPTEEIGKIINQTIRNSIDEIVSRINQEVSSKFSLITRQQYDSYASMINESLNAASSDIVNQLSTLTQTVQENTSDISQNNISSEKPAPSSAPSPQASPNTASQKVTTDTAKIMVEVGKVLQKSAKDISEQSSYINNISHEINSSISKFKKTFNFKNFIATVTIAWLFAGVGCYFISSYIINKVTKIQQYEQEHEAIQNLKVIKQNLDSDGLKCWDKIFGK